MLSSFFRNSVVALVDHRHSSMSLPKVRLLFLLSACLQGSDSELKGEKDGSSDSEAKVDSGVPEVPVPADTPVVLNKAVSGLSSRYRPCGREKTTTTTTYCWVLSAVIKVFPESDCKARCWACYVNLPWIDDGQHWIPKLWWKVYDRVAILILISGEQQCYWLYVGTH